MPRYFPIESPIDADKTLLLDLRWRPFALIAYFYIEDDDSNALRVAFENVEIFRVVEELYSSTEGVLSGPGYVRGHFAFRVEDGYFWNTQSKVLEDLHIRAKAYQFVTSENCLDVIARNPPVISVTPYGPAKRVGGPVQESIYLPNGAGRVILFSGNSKAPGEVVCFDLDINLRWRFAPGDILTSIDLDDGLIRVSGFGGYSWIAPHSGETLRTEPSG